MAVRVFTALPARPLHGRPPGLLNAVGLLLVTLLLAGSSLGLLLVFVPPSLVTDWQVRNTAVLLRDGEVAGNACPDAEMIQICNLVVSTPVGDDTVARRVVYLFGTPGDRSATPRAVADPARPGWLTTDVALDRFWNRVASFLLGLLVMGGLTAGGVWAGLRILLRRRAWHRTEALPVSLRLVSRQRTRNQQVWTVQGDDGPPERWPVPGRAEPFTLPDGRVLGLQRLHHPGVMPLDSKLRWVDLSRAERAAVLGPQGGA